MRKQVITVSDDELARLVDQLIGKILEDDFRPELIVGIARGGALAAEKINPRLAWPVVECSIHRAGTEVKTRIPGLTWILRRLPLPISDRLRLIEDRLRSQRPVGSAAERPNASVQAAAMAIRAGGYRQILILDDAVDSGVTLAHVLHGLRDLLPCDILIRTAALTRTRRPEDCVIAPDYFLYEYVLCRFPWSIDYKSIGINE